MDEIKKKEIEFNSAMELYEKKYIYKRFGNLISVVNVSLQITLLLLVFPSSLGFMLQVMAFVTAFLLTDFINGLVHLYMDNNQNYTSVTGPFVANFHLHHRTPLYKKNNLIVVYFNESGSKIWLAGFMITTIILLQILNISDFSKYIILYFCILSSVAEVSHYLCHVSNSVIYIFFSSIGIFLSKRHHGRHHNADNVSYAFLNGITDPLLDIIAKHFFDGYKNNTDLHYASYIGEGSDNRN